MRYCIVFLIALFVCSPRLAQSASTTETDEDSVVAFAKKVVVQALDYQQGDRESLMDAKDDFTEGGWSEFMKRMDGWLDDKGAALSSESFTPAGDTVVKSLDNGIIRLSIPGTLKQSQNKSSTTYRVVVDVQLSAEPRKIEHLEIRRGAGTLRRDGADARQTDIYRGVAHRIFERIAALKDRYPHLAAIDGAGQKEDAQDKLWIAYHYSHDMTWVPNPDYRPAFKVGRDIKLFSADGVENNLYFYEGDWPVQREVVPLAIAEMRVVCLIEWRRNAGALRTEKRRSADSGAGKGCV